MTWFFFFFISPSLKYQNGLINFTDLRVWPFAWLNELKSGLGDAGARGVMLRSSGSMPGSRDDDDAAAATELL